MAKRPSVPARPTSRAGVSNPVVVQQQPTTEWPDESPTSEAVARLLLQVLHKANSGLINNPTPVPPPPAGGPVKQAVDKYVAIAQQLATLADPAALRRPL